MKKKTLVIAALFTVAAGIVAGIATVNINKKIYLGTLVKDC